MKTTILLFSILFLTNSLHARTNNAPSRSNALLQFIAEQSGVRDLALQTIIGTRCSRYMPRSEKAPCKLAVSKMIDILDYDVIFADKKTPLGRALLRRNDQWGPRSFVFIAFKKNLISLLSNPKTTDYLKNLNQELYKFLVGEKEKLNIWNVTKGFYGTDHVTGMAMAAFFQDTSRMKLHLAYLELSNTQRGNLTFENNKELLGRVIDTINLVLDSSEDHYRELFYPEEIQKDLNRNIYHFYVPLYLTMALKKNGTMDRFSYAAPLMLNLTYEFITSGTDYRYVFRDPERIENLHKIKDIFGGYCGSNMALRGMNFNKSFEVIRASFERSTEDAVHLLLRH